MTTATKMTRSSKNQRSFLGQHSLTLPRVFENVFLMQSLLIFLGYLLTFMSGIYSNSDKATLLCLGLDFYSPILKIWVIPSYSRSCFLVNWFLWACKSLCVLKHRKMGHVSIHSFSSEICFFALLKQKVKLSLQLMCIWECFLRPSRMSKWELSRCWWETECTALVLVFLNGKNVFFIEKHFFFFSHESLLFFYHHFIGETVNVN